MKTDWSERVGVCKERFTTQQMEHIRDEIQPHIEQPVLEVGCGTMEMKDRFDEYVGMDFTPEFEPDVIGDAQSIPFDQNTFSTVMTKNVLQHVEYWQLAVSQCFEVARDRVVFTERIHEGSTYVISEEPVLRRRFDPDHLMDVMESYSLKVIRYDCGTDERLGIFVGLVQ